MNNIKIETHSEQQAKVCQYFQDLFEKQRGNGGQRPKGRHTELCAAYVNGTNCVYSPNCHFAHKLEDLRPQRQPLAHFKMRECNNFLLGCEFGSRCLFVHDDVMFKITPEITVYHSEIRHVYRVAKQCNDFDVFAYSFDAAPIQNNPDFKELLQNLNLASKFWPKENPIRLVKGRKPKGFPHSLIGVKEAYPGEKQSRILQRLIAEQASNSKQYSNGIHYEQDFHSRSKRTRSKRIHNQISSQRKMRNQRVQQRSRNKKSRTSIEPCMPQTANQIVCPPMYMAGIPTFNRSPKSVADASCVNVEEPYLDMRTTSEANPAFNYSQAPTCMVAGQPVFLNQNIANAPQQWYFYPTAQQCQQDPNQQIYYQDPNTMIVYSNGATATSDLSPTKDQNASPLMYPVSGNGVYVPSMVAHTSNLSPIKDQNASPLMYPVSGNDVYAPPPMAAHTSCDPNASQLMYPVSGNDVVYAPPPMAAHTSCDPNTSQLMYPVSGNGVYAPPTMVAHTSCDPNASPFMVPVSYNGVYVPSMVAHTSCTIEDPNATSFMMPVSYNGAYAHPTLQPTIVTQNCMDTNANFTANVTSLDPLSAHDENAPLKNLDQNPAEPEFSNMGLGNDINLVAYVESLAQTSTPKSLPPMDNMHQLNENVNSMSLSTKTPYLEKKLMLTTPLSTPTKTINLEENLISTPVTPDRKNVNELSESKNFDTSPVITFRKNLVWSSTNYHGYSL